VQLNPRVTQPHLNGYLLIEPPFDWLPDNSGHVQLKPI